MMLAKATSEKTIKTTTTLRVPTELRNQIAQLAERRGTSMVDVVSDAVDKLRVADWWTSVHVALDEQDASDIASYREEADRLDGASMDGLGE